MDSNHLMHVQDQQSGFHLIHQDCLWRNRISDAVLNNGKWLKPFACPRCKAVSHNGSWQWFAAPDAAQTGVCPASSRSGGYYPAGFLVLKGDLVFVHRDEVMNFVFDEARKERSFNPMNRIVGIEDKEGEIKVVTSDMTLACIMGVALHHAYQGKLDYLYNPNINSLRVEWTH